MIQIPPKDVFKARALAAIDAGALQCQQPGFGEHGTVTCCYTGPCVIGAVLEPEDRRTLDNYSGDLGVYYAIEGAHMIERPDWISSVELADLQDLHDQAAVIELRAQIEAL